MPVEVPTYKKNARWVDIMLSLWCIDNLLAKSLAALFLECTNTLHEAPPQSNCNIFM